MKRTAALVLSLFFCLALFAGDHNHAGLAQKDREFGVQYLNETKQAFLESVEGLSNAQLNFKPAPDRWSIAEVAEHIALSEEFIGSNITKLMASPEAPAERRAATKGMEEKILNMMPDRSQKAQAPEMLKPTGRFQSREEVLRAFNSKRDEHIDYLKNTKQNMRAHVQKSPFGEADAYQWMLFMAAHSKRHTAQIEEVKADPNFPKN
jgi:hypothetical protein